MNRWTLMLASCAAAALAGYVALHPLTRNAQAQSPSDPQYTSGGNLVRPKDFHTWIFVGSNLGLGYAKEFTADTPREATRADLGEYHNIYLKPEDYAAYVRTGTFPDKTVLVMDVYRAQTRDANGVVTAGSYNGLSLGTEVAVKNKNRPDRSTTDWAYYDFTDRSGGGHFPADKAAEADKDCYACHKAHAGDDNVWVQFYPVIRGVKNLR
jgi:Cytochrome P460